MRASICLSTRNKAGVLRLSLESIYRQSPPFDFEVIVVDDGGTDDAKYVCRRFPVRYFHLDNPRYRNPSKARNVAFRAARGEVVLAQSDDIIHRTEDTIERLANGLQRGEFLLARTHNYVYHGSQPATYVKEYCGPSWPKPFFFLGAISRKDLCRAGGYDEEFVEPCFDDDWFANVLMNGLGLKMRITEEVLAHHVSHGYEPGSHTGEKLSKKLYEAKLKKASSTGVWENSGGSWDLEPREPVVAPTHSVCVSSPFPPLFSTPNLEPVGSIPKRMHFFWTGPMSWMRYMTLYSFRYYHRDWDVVLHRMDSFRAGRKGWRSTETQDTQTYAGPDYSRHLDRIDAEEVPWSPPDEFDGLAPSHACDLCQWSLMAGEGGWYADMDILWTGTLPHETLKGNDAVFCLTDSWMAIGLMASSGDSDLFRAIYEVATKRYKPDRYQSTGAEAVYYLAGTWPDWGSIPQVGVCALNNLRRRYRSLSITDVPQSTVYPWNYLSVDNIFEKSLEIPGGCCGIHWFGGNGTAQKWNDILTHENYEDHDSTFTRYVAEVLR